MGSACSFILFGFHSIERAFRRRQSFSHSIGMVEWPRSQVSCQRQNAVEISRSKRVTACESQNQDNAHILYTKKPPIYHKKYIKLKQPEAKPSSC